MKYSFKTMSLDEVKSAVNSIGAGEFHHITFYSKPKTTDGSEIIKVNDTQIRTKIDHTHCAAYEVPSYHRHEDSVYEISDALKTNLKTGNTLLKVCPKWSTYKTEYFESDGTPITKTEALSRIKSTTKSVDEPLVITANASQIISLT